MYDAASDWTPIYDKTDRQGFYVAMGTSGNQFKNAPIAGRLMSRIIDQVEAGHDHDADPLTYVGMHTGLEIDLGAFLPPSGTQCRVDRDRHGLEVLSGLENR